MSWNVMLVEADAAVAEEIRAAFAPAGFVVASTEAGESAVDRTRAAAPDLILLSAELPDMSGFSVCNRIKRALPATPLILYTREATDGAIEAHRASKGKADAYLRAPLDMADLLGHAASLLHGERAATPAPVAPPVSGTVGRRFKSCRGRQLIQARASLTSAAILDPSAEAPTRARTALTTTPIALPPVVPLDTAFATSSATMLASSSSSIAAGRYFSMIAASARSFTAASVRSAPS